MREEAAGNDFIGESHGNAGKPTRNSTGFTVSQKQRLDKGIGVKRLKVVQGFADADEFDGQIHRLADGDDNASFRGAVELGQDHAGAADALGEDLGLADRVLAVGGVDDQQDFVGRTGDQPLDHVADLFQLAHQVRLGMQAPGGVDDQDVDVAGQGALAGVVGHAGRVGPGRPLDDLAAGAVGPDRELVGGGGAERVASGQEDRVALIFEILRQLGDRGRLARAVDAGDQVDGRRLGGDRKGSRAADLPASPLSSSLTNLTRFSSAVFSA